MERNSRYTNVPLFLSETVRTKDRAKLTTKDKTYLSDTACSRARLPAGRMASPIDEILIPPGTVRPARSRALPDDYKKTPPPLKRTRW
jgi:hypothetical protein